MQSPYLYKKENLKVQMGGGGDSDIQTFYWSSWIIFQHQENFRNAFIKKKILQQTT